MPRQGSSGRADYREKSPPYAARGRPGRLSSVRWVRPQQAFELLSVQAVAAHHRTLQEQHRHFQAVATLQLRVRVHVKELDRRQGVQAAEALKLSEHLLAQLTVVPLHD